MKWAFQLALCERARIDERIHLVIGDVGAVMFESFRREFPGRFFNAGLCEQSMVSLAAGMAIEGLRPIVYTITPFLIERAFEQIKLDVNEMKLPVGLVGYSDLSVGPTHTELPAWWYAWPFPNISATWIGHEHKHAIPNFIRTVPLDRPWFLGLRG